MTDYGGGERKGLTLLSMMPGKGKIKKGGAQCSPFFIDLYSGNYSFSSRRVSAGMSAMKSFPLA